MTLRMTLSRLINACAVMGNLTGAHKLAKVMTGNAEELVLYSADRHDEDLAQALEDAGFQLEVGKNKYVKIFRLKELDFPVAEEDAYDDLDPAGTVYLVQQIFDWDELSTPTTMTAKQIFDILDMDDCYHVEMRVYDISTFGVVTPLIVNGTWHDGKDPLRMTLERPDGSIAAVGYGTDH